MSANTQTADPDMGASKTTDPPQPEKTVRPNCDRTYYENPLKTEPSRVHRRDAPETEVQFTDFLRKEGGIAKARDLEEILQRQRGFEDLVLSAPLPSSSDRTSFKTDLARGQIEARIGLIEKDFARMAGCPEGIERLRILALVAMDAYQPEGYKYVPRSQAEISIYNEAKETWENLCEKSELSDIHYRRRASENLVGTYNGILKQCQKLDKRKGWHFFDANLPIEVPEARRDVGEDLDGWFDVSKDSKTTRRNLLSSECWCYEETIGPDGKPRGEIVKRLKPTAGQYALRAMDYVCGSQSSGEFVGALLGTALGFAYAAACRPYANSVSEATAEKMVLLNRLREYPSGPSQEEKERREQRKTRWRPKEGPELSKFAEGPPFTMQFPPVAGEGYTIETPHGQYRVTPNPGVQSPGPNDTPPDNKFHPPPPDPDPPPFDGREGSEDRPSL